MAEKQLITYERLREVLDYDPETGVFKWKVAVARRVKIGDEAGNIKNGYLEIECEGTRAYAHRLAWLWMTGKWPPQCIDHINLVRIDNRFSNLRLATFKDNAGNRLPNRNNKSGMKGIFYRADRRKWAAHIYINGRSTHLGHFGTAEEARAAYKEAAERHFGSFARF